MGAAAGWVASLITKTNNGIFGDIVVGIIGALLGGFIVSLFGQLGITGFNLYSFLVSVLGAVLLLWFFKSISGTAGHNVQ